MDSTHDEQFFNDLIETLREETRQLGLHLHECAIGTTGEDAARLVGEESLRSVIADGRVPVFMAVTFLLGDRAFSTEVQNPEQAVIDREAQAMLPTELDLFLDRLKQARKDGRDMFDLGDEFSADDGDDG